MNAKKTRRGRWRVGDVVAIPLGESGQVGFGLVLKAPLMAFFDASVPTGREPSAEQILRYPVAFKIWVMRKPLVSGEWPRLGSVEVPDALMEEPWFFMQDALNGKITITKTGAEQFPPEPGQVDNLECAAVWSACHVVDRLQDHFAGRPNKWVESARPKPIPVASPKST
ncbi:MAG: immunity 26/phosphotriesterase HocA family protein [Polyangiaceae bacterium]|nr:immunity 26/phosphotriesterase HocA family protein [Polyangiaceae bacterium]